MPREATTQGTLDSPEADAKLAALYGQSRLPEARRRYASLARALGEAHPGAELRFYAAPGRTELGGNHTDHNHGRVLCAAVDLDAVACACPVPGRSLRLRSAGHPDELLVELDDLAPRAEERGRPAALVRGALEALAVGGVAAVGGGVGALRGAEIRVDATLPEGAGLSSSAAFSVLVAAVVADLSGLALGPLELARAARHAENRHFGKPCGLMDQAASALGGVAALDFRDPEAPSVRRLELDLAAAGLALTVTDTGGSHADLTADYAAIPAEMAAAARLLGGATMRDIDPALLLRRGPELRAALGDRAFLRAWHFLREDARAAAMAEALAAGDLKRHLGLVRASGDSSWRFLQNVCPPGREREQALGVALALAEDCLGEAGAARVHGGGFAGAVQAYVPVEALEGYRARMEAYFGPDCVRVLGLRAQGAGRVI